MTRAVAAWREARRAHVPFLVHDADPLADVAEAWVSRLDGTGPLGELEVAVRKTLVRWRAGLLELPDYYLVVDAESLEVTKTPLVPGRAEWRRAGAGRPRAAPPRGGARRDLPTAGRAVVAAPRRARGRHRACGARPHLTRPGAGVPRAG